MGIKRHKPEEIVTKLRQVDVLVGQGMVRTGAIRQVSGSLKLLDPHLGLLRHLACCPDAD